VTDEKKPQDADKKKRDEELDSFWDIDALIPKRRAPHYAADTETAEIVLEVPASERSEHEKTESRHGERAIPPRTEPIVSSDQVKRRFIPPHTADEESRRPTPEREYTPDNALIPDPLPLSTQHRQEQMPASSRGKRRRRRALSRWHRSSP